MGKVPAPPSFKKICPCKILPPFFKIFQIPQPPTPPPPKEVIKIYPSPFKKEGGANYVQLLCYYVLCSDELNHDKNTIFFYNSYIINYLKSKRLIFNMVHYWSDGPSSQFKNQYNFTNLLLHQMNHGMSADWNFFMTSNRKKENDSAGRDVKNAGERFCRIKLLLEIFSLLLPLPKKSFLLLPLKSLNQMKYVMQQNNSLNTWRNILSTFTAHKNSITLVTS